MACRVKRLIFLIIIILLYSQASWAYISQADIERVSVGDTVYIKLGSALDGNGIVKTFDKATKMAGIEMKNLNGNTIMLSIHAGWIMAIVNDVPEVVNDVDALKQQIADLQAKIQALEAYIAKLKAKIAELCELIK